MLVDACNVVCIHSAAVCHNYVVDHRNWQPAFLPPCDDQQVSDYIGHQNVSSGECGFPLGRLMNGCIG